MPFAERKSYNSETKTSKTINKSKPKPKCRLKTINKSKPKPKCRLTFWWNILTHCGKRVGHMKFKLEMRYAERGLVLYIAQQFNYRQQHVAGGLSQANSSTQAH
jgi:hypothetical protein